MRTHSSSDLDLLSRWALAALATTALLTVGYTIIHTAAEVDQTRAQLGGALPANYRDTLKAILAATGAACHEVCEMSAIRAAAGRTTFKVSCTAAAADTACSAPLNYILTVEPAPIPSR